ncbi:TonB-dependent receptor [uncultured Chitinophaga sp.]|uniref:TonB-dependent receptor n=1 Tax=uncultured Chitinophaga sp. TaxID=339340 RepID=UPI0025CC5707|nr:TonB-dependent receptor [uncultured Chitinophaga sp.]
MKITTFLLLIALHISAKGVSQQVTLSVKNAPLKKVFKEVARQTGISIFYDEGVMEATRPVTLQVKDKPVEEVLEACLKNQPVSFTIQGNRVTISLPENPAPLQDTAVSVSGRVTNEAGEPVPGVTVRIKGSTTGTTTDASGHYSLRVPKVNTGLEFSYVGFATETLVPRHANTNVILKESSTALNETVVVGYGVQKKSVVTGAISSVRAKDIDGMPITRLEQVLQGRTSGLTIAQSSGQPGSGSTVRVRGITTFNNNDPLWVIDGVVVDNGGIGYLNQYDIESVEVLKDAASQAIYGARAASGVILVTTKKGKAGKLTVNYNAWYGTSAPARKLKLLNATEYATLRNEADVAGNKPLPYADPSVYGEGTDWQEQIFNNDARRQNHELSISGGNDRSTFYTSFGFLKMDGIVATDISKYKRFNVRLNSTHKLAKWLTIGQNVGYAYDKSIGLGNTNSEFGGPLSSAINLDPITPAVVTDPAAAAAYPYTNVGIRRDALGRPYGISTPVGQEITNPLAYITTRLGNYGWSHNTVGNIYLEAEPIKGLRLRSVVGAKLSFWGSESFTPISWLNSSTISSRTSFNRGNNQGFNWNVENTISYTRLIGGHDFTVMAGQGAYMDGRTRNINVTFNDVPANTFEEASLNFKVPPDKRLSDGGEGADHRISSLFARINYNYKEKYLAEAIIRRDGSSRFGPNNKYGVFPSFSMGWVLSQEDFFPKGAQVNTFKLRGGYGVVGNDNIGDFAYLATIGSGRNYTLGTSGSYIVGYSPNAPSNPDLKWEETSQMNVGFEAMLFNDFNVTFDWYIKKTKDILQNPRIPFYVGAISNPAANVADMENKGVELELGYRKNISGLNIYVSGNGSYLKNRVTNLGTGIAYLSGGQGFQASSYPITRTALNQPLNSFYGFRTNGIFQNMAEVQTYVNKEGAMLQPNAAPGDFRWVDVNGDGLISELDRDFIGNPTPTWTYGFTLNLEYKGFDFVFFGQGAAGNKIFQGLRRLDITNANWQTKALGRWTGEGTSNSFPRLNSADPNKNFTNPSDFYLENGSYCRIKTIQLGYSLPSALIRKVALQKARIYLMSENLLTFTKYTGYDPEIGGGVMSIDRGIYPQARSFMLGVNVTF